MANKTKSNKKQSRNVSRSAIKTNQLKVKQTMMQYNLGEFVNDVIDEQNVCSFYFYSVYLDSSFTISPHN